MAGENPAFNAMPITFAKESGVFMGIANETYYLDANEELTTDSEKAAYVLINKGQEVPQEMADKYSIGKVAQPESDEGEKSETPTANKRALPSKNKGVK